MADLSGKIKQKEELIRAIKTSVDLTRVLTVYEFKNRFQIFDRIIERFSHLNSDP